MNEMTFFDLSAHDLDGNEIPFSRFHGSICMVVNTSSKGIDKYELRKLSSLQEQFRSRGLKILAFPCRQFIKREKKNNNKIKKKYYEKEKLKFNVFGITKVNGENSHLVFKWLKSRAGNVLGRSIEWNFTKFIITNDGKSVKRLSSAVDYDSIIAIFDEILPKETPGESTIQECEIAQQF